MSDAATGPTALVVDLGTGGPKTAIVTISGEVIGSAHERVEPLVEADGTAVQDPSAWWTAIAAGARSLTAAHPDAATALVAVSVTGMWGSTVPVDSSGAPTGECLLWMDTRARRHASRTMKGTLNVEGMGASKALNWVRRSGGAPSTQGNDPLGHRLWIRHEEPDVYERTTAFVEAIDFVNACFTGEVAANPISMLLSWACDNRHPERVAYDDTLVGYLGIDPAKLPPLKDPRRPIGTVLDAVADDLGLPRDLPVVAALPDLHTAALGSGAVGMFESHVSISTSAWVGCYTPFKRTSLSKQMATVPTGLPGRYVLANNHETAGVCVEWAHGTFVEAADGLTTPADSSLAAFDAVAGTSPSGAGGVLFTPWLNGERSPVADATLRGAFHNLSLSTDRADMVRAVLEGVAHNARWLLEASEKVVRNELGEPRLIGGGCASDVWCQIHADVIGRPMHRVAAPLLANVRGGALFAGIALGHHEIDDVAGLVTVERTFEPDAAARRTHDLMYDEFVGLAKLEKDMYRRLNRRGGLR